MDENTPTPAPEIPAAFAGPAAAERRHHLLSKGAIAGIAVASVLSIGAAGGGILVTATLVSSVAAERHTTTTAESVTPDQGTAGLPGFGQEIVPQYRGGQQQAPWQEGSSEPTRPTQTTQNAATDEQSAGIVLIDTVVGFNQGEAAGTGIVLTSDGTILTNNHVVEGSTKIAVTIAATGKTYVADVVGTDATNDIAVLQLRDASGLATADLDTSNAVSIGDVITGVGNAEGQGYLSAAEGQVTALDQQITVADELTGKGKTLGGLIETDAAIVSGDSGGPLFDSDGEVIGIDTAASSNTQEPTGYAIPITHAIDIARQIESGVETNTITIGLPAFLGVQLGSTTSVDGVTIGGAIAGTAADRAGLAAGDTITEIDGTAVSSADALSSAIAAHDPGDSVTITWIDPAGETQSATVVLTEGPAA